MNCIELRLFLDSVQTRMLIFLLLFSHFVSNLDYLNFHLIQAILF